MDDCTYVQPHDSPHNNLHSDTGPSIESAEHHQDPSGLLPSSINALALDFVKAVDIRFGERSKEAAQIHDVLISFGRGETSKKEALSSVSNALGYHLDLRYQLLDILKHENSRWGPEDFNLPLLSSLHSAPPFLQPVHQPQMRLPSMSNLWNSNDVVSSAADQMTANGQQENPCQEPTTREEPDRFTAEYEQRRNSTHAGVLPRIESTFTNGDGLNQLTSSDVGLANKPSPPSASNRRTSLQQSARGETASVHNFNLGDVCHGASHGNNWASHGPDQQQEYHHNFASEQYSSMAHDIAHSVESSHHLSQELGPGYQHPPHQEQGFAQEALHQNRGSGSLSLDNPFVMTAPQSAVKPPARSRKRNRKTSVAQMRTEHPRQDHGAVEHDQRELSPTDIGLIKEQSDRDAPFIHALCGKGFVSRSKVKKHHWGGKINDINTTTGCWAKHKKPDAEWDDHPSCKEVPRDATRPPKQARKRSNPPEKKASVVPSMTPSRYAALPTLSTLGNKPQHVEEAPDSLHISPRFAQGTPAMFHSHFMPPTSPFETLLTAVNVASNIEAPVAQGRHQSIVNQLDAQALATERSEHDFPAWAVPPCQHREEGENQQHFQPAPFQYGHDFDISPVHTSMWMGAPHPHVGRGDSYAPSVVSPMECSFGDPSVMAGRGMEYTTELQHPVYEPQEWESPTRSLSPGPEKKRRCMT